MNMFNPSPLLSALTITLDYDLHVPNREKWYLGEKKWYLGDCQLIGLFSGIIMCNSLSIAAFI